uniref:Cytosolic arginine sensor for mTORC1 subunit 2 n=1 Tax=Eptatretus burgeri TaxID=7764 RepID=A0A8C4R7P5_EPTBU
MELHILDHRLKIASVPRDSLHSCTHGVFKLAFLAEKTRCKFFSFTQTPEDYTLIVDEEGLKEFPASERLTVADATWAALNVASGGGHSPAAASAVGVTKIAKSVIAPLADHNVSVFMLSTYQTDFILVRERDLPTVVRTLSAEFIFVVAVDFLVLTYFSDITSPARRPIIHPLACPLNRFCITSLDPATLPSVATLLMDIMFYSDGFPNNLLFTSSSNEMWKMVRIGGQPLGFDECGIVAQISEPLASGDILAYYISTYKFDHALVPEEEIDNAVSLLTFRPELSR